MTVEAQTLVAPPAAAESPAQALRVWFAHDWLTGFRGGEKLLLELIRAFPNSRIATLFHIPGSTHPDIDARVARTSFLQHFPGVRRHYRNLLPLFPLAVRELGAPADCDLVISSSHCLVKGLPVPRGVPHLCYCHTPMRYVWDLHEHYFAGTRRWSVKQALANMAVPTLRRVDRAQNGSIAQFATNSQYIADRIRRCYGREAEVIHPGFDDASYTPAAAGPEDFYLVVSALVPYKRVDLAVQACLTEPRRRLVVIGKGPEDKRLRAMAAGQDHIRFLGWADDETIRWHYQHCQALLFPGEEDFGIVPLEAQGCGRPVIAFNAGGARETVVGLVERPSDGRPLPPPTGVFHDQQTVESLRGAMARYEANREAFKADRLRAHALQFTWPRFRERMIELAIRTVEAKRVAGG